MRPRAWIRIGAVVFAATVVGAVGAVGAVVWQRMHDYPVHRFGVVVPGVLYRSAQPDENGWKALYPRYAIRTVFDLREDTPNKPWAVLEQEFCRRNGIKHIKMPVGPYRLTDAQLARFVEVVTRPESQPVLVHCELGRSRTGVVVAAYRIVVQGWRYQAAIADARRYTKTMNAGYAAYLRELAGGQR